MEHKGLINPIESAIVKQIENAVQVNHKYPVNFNEQDAKWFSHYTGYKTQNETTLQFDDVNVSYDAIIFKKLNNSYQSVPHVAFRADYGWLYILKNYLFRKRIKTHSETKYVLIYDFWSAGNYYHWLIDTLPRLLSVQQELKQTNYSLLLPTDCSEFIKRTLSYCEINHITYIKPNEFLKIKHLLVPYYFVGSGHLHPLKVLEVKRFFENKINATSDKTKIYVSRGRQKARKILNEVEVINIVNQFGFQVVYFEDYTFEQQVAIGKGAKFIVSSHGANLTNIMFMGEKTRVLELIKSEAPNFCYWSLANVANLNYYYQLCEVKGNDHLWVDLELFKLNLQKILND